MAYQNKLLFRDDTNDDGSTPSHGGTYQSPDIKLPTRKPSFPARMRAT